MVLLFGNKEKKYVYLTFDEGYEAGYTSKILDTLKENNVKAAFFITGSYLNRETALVKRMVDEGHTLRKSYFKSSIITRSYRWRKTKRRNNEVA